MNYEITPQEVKRKLDHQESITLLDARETDEYVTAHIAGSMLIPMREIPMRGHQELDFDHHIVVVCHPGVRSLNLTNWLRQQGFDSAESMQGSIGRWSREIDPTVPSDGDRLGASFGHEPTAKY